MTDAMSFISIAVSLFLVFNATGYVPVFMAVLAPYSHERQKKIIIREVVIAFVIIVCFIFFGATILELIGISKAIIGLAGGLLLIIIALNLIFPKEDESVKKQKPKREPFLVPLAMPGLAGPGTIAATMLFATQYGTFTTAAAFTAAWVPSLIILYLSSYLKKYLGEKGLHAIEKFGGMLLSLIGMKMFAYGIIELVKDNF